MVDLFMLIYHFISVFIAETIAIHNAQTIRHGYTSLKRSINSMAMLVLCSSFGDGKRPKISSSLWTRGVMTANWHSRARNPPKTGAIASIAVYLGLYIACNYDQHDSAFQVNHDEFARI